MIRPTWLFIDFISTAFGWAFDSHSESLHTSASLGVARETALNGFQEALRKAGWGSQSELSLCGAVL